MLRVGQLLRGFCDGHFGGDSYLDKRIEGIGADWIVAREIGCGGYPVFASGDDIEELVESSQHKRRCLRKKKLNKGRFSK